MARRILAMLLVVVILIIVVGLMLPRSITIERSRLIDQPAPIIFEVLNDLRHFPEWSPWDGEEATPSYRREGPDAGPGATLIWNEGGGDRAGRLWIVDNDPPRRIDLKMELGESEVDSYFLIASDTGEQRVTWGMRVDFSTFDLTGRYVGLMLPALIGPSYEDGLERLADYLGRTPGAVPPVSDEPTAAHEP
jgi:uncharacterized protein YndB with AHSA1/START domain